MNDKKQDYEKKLTIEEIQSEINKIGDFFKQIPDELKADAAERFIYEIVNWGCRDHYQALGIFQEAMLRYREVSNQVLAEEAEEDLLETAFESSQDYRCIEEIDIDEDRRVSIGEICRIGFVEGRNDYSGGRRYEVFKEEGIHFSICQHVLDTHFELFDGEEKELN